MGTQVAVYKKHKIWLQYRLNLPKVLGYDVGIEKGENVGGLIAYAQNCINLFLQARRRSHETASSPFS